jgi:hypothetical protein
MNLKNVHIELDTSDIQKIMAISLDDDRDQALVFVKNRLAKQVEKALQPH